MFWDEKIHYVAVLYALAGNQTARFCSVRRTARIGRNDEKAARAEGNTGEILLSLIERRLDNVVYRLRFASTRREARQLVNHGHYTVNGKRVNIPSYMVKVGDVIAVCEKSSSNNRFKKMKEDNAFVAAPKWLDRDTNNLQGKVIALPARDDIDFEIAEHLIVELYSK